VDQTNTDVEEDISVSLIHWDIDRFYDIFSPDILLLLNVNVFLNISVSLIHWDIDKFYDIFCPDFLLLTLMLRKTLTFNKSRKSGLKMS
jgi:hypothetical protein